MSIIIKGGTSAATADVTDAGELKVALSTGAFGALSVSTDPTVAFYDTFEGSTLDTVNRWNNYGSVAPVQSQGNINLSPGTTANATVVVSSQPQIPINTAMVLAGLLTMEPSTALGNHRFWGFGTAPGNVGTTAAPLTDAIGFEVDTSGVMRASVYNSGSRVFTTVLGTPTDGYPHFYMLQARGDVAFFYKDNYAVPAAQTYITAASQLLPMRMASLNSATVSGSPIFQIQGFSILDMSRQASALADGTYPWRKAKVDAAGAQLTTVQPATGVTANGPSSVTATTVDTLLLAANTARRGAAVTNDSTAALYLSLGTTTASATTYTVKIPAGGYYEVPFGYTGQIRGIWSSANGAARLTEVVAP